MTGTLINVVAILVGSALGLAIGNRLPAKMQSSVITGLGTVTLVLGVGNALGSGQILVPLLSMAAGAIIGELLDIDGALKRFGGWLQTRFGGGSGTSTGEASDDGAAARARFISGFVTASLLFCVGPMAVLGSIQNGIDAGDFQVLAIKSTLDFFASIAFAASLGIGVAFSVIPTVVIQGAFALVGVALAGALSAGGAPLSSDVPILRELTATGGLILIALSLILMDIKQPRVANYLPALVIAPLLVLLATALGVNIYPTIPLP
jgi:hypothetical protein